MARGPSAVSAKIPAVKTADKAVAQWKAMRREYGDDRLGEDLGITHFGDANPQIVSSGILSGSFANREQQVFTRKAVLDTKTVVDSAQRGVLIADVSTWGAISVWLLSWVAAMSVALEGGMDEVIDKSLNYIYDKLQKKAAEGARLVIIRHVCSDVLPKDITDDSGEVIGLLFHEPCEMSGMYSLAPFEGSAEGVNIVYSALMEMGRAYSNSPGLDPEVAQMKAVQIIAAGCWRTSMRDARRANRETSLDTEISVAPVFRFTKDDQSITSATDCVVTNKNGDILKVIPALSEVTEIPDAPVAVRTSGIEYLDHHWKGDNRAAEVRALSHVSRIELVNWMPKHAQKILVDKRTGKWIKNAYIVTDTARVILDLRAANCLRAKYQDEEHADKYRNLSAQEIATEVGILLGEHVTKYQVGRALELLHAVEDEYWHAVHTDNGDPYLKDCHLCNESRDDLVRQAKPLARRLLREPTVETANEIREELHELASLAEQLHQYV